MLSLLFPPVSVATQRSGGEERLSTAFGGARLHAGRTL